MVSIKINQVSSELLPRPAKEAVNRGPAPQSGQGRAANAPAGKLVRGTVIAKTSGGYLVKTAAGVLTADSLVPLEVGREIWFEQFGGSGSELVLAGPQKAMPAIMRLLLPLLGASANPLAHNLPPGLAAYGAGSQADPVKLLAFIAAMSNGGTADNTLFDPFAVLTRHDGRQASQTAENAVSTLQNLFGAHAQLNSLAPVSQQGQNLFLYPCFFAGTSGWGEWLFSFNRQEGRGSDSSLPEYAVSFYLTMSRLGEMHLQLSGQGKELRGRFTMASRAAAAHVSAHLAQLLPTLERLYQPVTLSCRYESVNNLQKIKTDLAHKTGTSADLFTLVNLTA
ncbi:MAG: hypothetical protein GXP59_00855 [Deltaproteobacteria bacterium]|nr:hypothetical protein [Deltaproteobacteria bacterium]